MKSNTSAALLFGLTLLGAGSIFAQTTATTVPVGFITKTLNGKVGSLDGNTAFSVPLYNTPDFQGTVATIPTASSFTLTGAAWTAGVYAMPADGGTATVPRLIRIKASSLTSPSPVGKFLRVTANSTNELTVDLSLYGLANISSILAVGDTVELLPANTLKSVLGAPPLLAGNTTAATADNVLLQNGAGWLTFFWRTNLTPNRWVLNAGGTADRGDTIIYPDDGVYVLRRTVGDVALTLMGTVPSTNEQSLIAAPNAFLANRFPTDTTLGALGIENLPGWVKNTTASTSDNVYVLTAGGAWSRYFYHSTANMWRLSGGGNADRGTTAIPAGLAVYLSFASATPATLAGTLPYTP